MAAKQQSFMACHDLNRRTCIQVERSVAYVKFIPLSIELGLEVQSTSVDSFDQRYTPMEGYPVEKACQLFTSYSQTLGATKEAMEYLGRIINITKQEVEMATTKKRVSVEKAVAEKAAPAPKPTKVTASGKVKEPTKATPKPEGKKQTAAQMFQDLILAGKLTDAQIFEKVQAEFGLDEKKRGYVGWYRNHLKKQGQNPPDAKAK